MANTLQIPQNFYHILTFKKLKQRLIFFLWWFDTRVTSYKQQVSTNDYLTNLLLKDMACSNYGKFCWLNKNQNGKYDINMLLRSCIWSHYDTDRQTYE